jgi:diacylglycerol kinase family enzyme
VGLGVAVGGSWWVLTERTARRGLGVVGVMVGIATLVGALVGAASDGEQVALHLGIFLGLLVITLVMGRAATSIGVREEVRLGFRPSAAPVHPVLLCNPWSGGGKVERFHLVELATELRVETRLLDRGLDLEQMARDAVAQGADCLGMAGGDGSQALVASIAIEHDIPFVCVSAGTRNHFALDLGIDREDPRRSVYAFRDGLERTVDFATVSGRLFVNNVSLGLYATIVQEESYREAKLETSKTLLPELLGRTGEPFDLQFATPDGREIEGSFLVMVSNNPYVMGPSLDVTQRRRLDAGQLGVFAVTAQSGLQAAEMMTLALAGQGTRSGHVFEFTTREFEIRSRSGRAFAGIDGEALELETPLVFRIHPRGLRVLVPQGNVDQAIRRRGHEVHMGDLVSIIRGKPPVSAAPK